DHYLWEKELEKDQANQNKAIINYTFRPNRSIEHLYPQTSDKPWVEKDLHSFGNLAMISPGFNSTQSNDDILVKFARIEKQIRGPYLLENIKLLFMYQKGNGKEWTIELAKEHEKEMIQILADSFPQGHVCNDALNSMIQNQQDN
ncbi:MAG: DUF1524 domain-containing protein, partial [Bacteroidota bacterium]|nr:DUF1524 domain-containing protein [Bacteroidota bacterium]